MESIDNQLKEGQREDLFVLIHKGWDVGFLSEIDVAPSLFVMESNQQEIIPERCPFIQKPHQRTHWKLIFRRQRTHGYSRFLI